MFTPADRNHLRAALVEAARADIRIAGLALTGSAAVDGEDRWSDIDLALSVRADHDRVVADWTARMYDAHAAAHHLDLYRENILYRVFLLASTLQVDLAFWPEQEFGAIAPTFRLVFGSANERPPRRPPAPAELAGLGWLYALHARSSIARGRLWQAEYMLSAARDQALALACLRYGLPAVHGRGVDQLPAAVTARFAGGLPRSLDGHELARAFGVILAALAAEIEQVDSGLAGRLCGPLSTIAGTAEPGAAADPPKAAGR